ncbi:MAG: S-layer homology domain-containing protein [Clostridia bacterium]|nr:S-layer homology domain-containing protein [Clostridia bacterium]
MKFKKGMTFVITLLTVFCLLFTGAVATGDVEKNKSEETSNFKDIKENHWAYDAINEMVKRGVLSGYPDSTFKPNKSVTRAEFAKMMVLALELSLKNPETSTFKDIDKQNWVFPFVETAKYYLTGFRTSSGDYFRPELEAVREDMAVALVKTLDYQNEESDQGILNSFYDVGAISPNLKKYVSIAVKHNIMKGYPLEKSELKAFKPQGPLTRAEAATLLYNFINVNKVTYDEKTDPGEKFTMDEETGKAAYEAPKVSLAVEGGKLVVKWQRITDSRLEGYKVVASKNNPYPRYPDDGYLYWITDKSRTSATVSSKESYNGGDFGGKFIAGEKYYFSVTAVYKDIKLPGNAVGITFPNSSVQNANRIPKVSGKVDGNKILLSWEKIEDESLNGYKVVISKNNSKPKYPEDGYLYWITDRNKTTAVIDNAQSYNGGDVGGKLIPGQKYYFSVTAVYNDEKIAGNAVNLTFPGTSAGESGNTVSNVPTLTAKIEGGKIYLKWNMVSGENGFWGYKVVISKNNPKPKYPDDGYLYYISNRSETSAIVDASKYYEGDIHGNLVPGQKYYFSITALYGSGNVAGNVLQLTMPGE